jgi:hypothetical protein
LGIDTVIAPVSTLYRARRGVPSQDRPLQGVVVRLIADISGRRLEFPPLEPRQINVGVEDERGTMAGGNQLINRDGDAASGAGHGDRSDFGAA